MFDDVMNDALPREVSNRADDKHERLRDILDIICENVAFEWKRFAREIGVNGGEIREIEASFMDTHSQCLQVIQRWRAANSRATLRDLVMALRKCRLGRVADLVTKLSHSRLSVDETLTPHQEREAKMRECLYLVADRVSRNWHVLAEKLGLSTSEVGRIRALYEGRFHEKCMLALYRWRAMVPLADYKVSSVIRALRAASMHDMAQALATYSSSDQTPWTKYKRKKGEAHIHIEVDELIMATEWDVNSADMLPSDNMSCISEVNTISTHRSDASSVSRIKLSLNTDALQNYALNKCFYRLLDDLDLQDRHGLHAINSYFRNLHKDLHLSHVSRPHFFLVVQATSKNGISALWDAFCHSTMSEELTHVLVKRDILEELSIAKMRLKIKIGQQDISTCLNELS